MSRCGHSEVEDIVKKAIDEYNRYRSPEANAELVDLNLSRGTLLVRFAGSFCMTCGLIDWIEDLAYIIEDHGIKAKLMDVDLSKASHGEVLGLFSIEC